MSDIRVEDCGLIKEEYIKLKGNVKLKEFAEKHGVKYSTLRSRKNRENLDNEDNSKKDDVLTKMLEGLKNGI